jgi:hypothetical protein
MKSYTYGLAKTERNQGNKILVLFTYSFQAPLALLVLTDKRFLSMFERVLNSQQKLWSVRFCTHSFLFWDLSWHRHEI